MKEEAGEEEAALAVAAEELVVVLCGCSLQVMYYSSFSQSPIVE